MELEGKIYHKSFQESSEKEIYDGTAPRNGGCEANHTLSSTPNRRRVISKRFSDGSPFLSAPPLNVFGKRRDEKLVEIIYESAYNPFSLAPNEQRRRQLEPFRSLAEEEKRKSSHFSDS